MIHHELEAQDASVENVHFRDVSSLDVGYDSMDFHERYPPELVLCALTKKYTGLDNQYDYAIVRHPMYASESLHQFRVVGGPDGARVAGAMGLVARNAQRRLATAPATGEPGRAVRSVQGVDRSGRSMSEVAEST